MSRFGLPQGIGSRTAPFTTSRSASSVLPLTTFASQRNPGQLVAKKFVPTGLIAGAPLVVVLHGCTQTPEVYDRGTGWSRAALRSGFAVLYPEQQRANNMNTCFNWFEPGDTRRGQGEAASIKAMIDAMIIDYAIDPARVFITGLSAGGAMANVMLATYPETFAAGAIIAGLPYGCARSMPAAFSRMRTRGHETDAQLGQLVRDASSHDGPWPHISVWHGTADATVAPTNADATVAQWRNVHGLRAEAVEHNMVDGHQHRIWRGEAGGVMIEDYLIKGMGHGTPLDALGSDGEEIAAAFLLDVGISSTRHLTEFWGIGVPVGELSTQLAEARVSTSVLSQQLPVRLQRREMNNVQQIIENALRSAGLM